MASNDDFEKHKKSIWGPHFFNQYNSNNSQENGILSSSENSSKLKRSSHELFQCSPYLEDLKLVMCKNSECRKRIKVQNLVSHIKDYHQQTIKSYTEANCPFKRNSLCQKVEKTNWNISNGVLPYRKNCTKRLSETSKQNPVKKKRIEDTHVFYFLCLNGRNNLAQKQAKSPTNSLCNSPQCIYKRRFGTFYKRYASSIVYWDRSWSKERRTCLTYSSTGRIKQSGHDDSASPRECLNKGSFLEAERRSSTSGNATVPVFKFDMDGDDSDNCPWYRPSSLTCPSGKMSTNWLKNSKFNLVSSKTVSKREKFAVVEIINKNGRNESDNGQNERDCREKSSHNDVLINVSSESSSARPEGTMEKDCTVIKTSYLRYQSTQTDEEIKPQDVEPSKSKIELNKPSPTKNSSPLCNQFLFQNPPKLFSCLDRDDLRNEELRKLLRPDPRNEIFKKPILSPLFISSSPNATHPSSLPNNIHASLVSLKSHCDKAVTLVNGRISSLKTSPLIKKSNSSNQKGCDESWRPNGF